MALASSIISNLSGESHTTPAISVVMPTYNGERFLRPAIESILNQTFPNFELIIIDDGSTDNTPRILSEFKDTRLTVLTNQQNLGKLPFNVSNGLLSRILQSIIARFPSPLATTDPLGENAKQLTPFLWPRKLAEGQG